MDKDCGLGACENDRVYTDAPVLPSLPDDCDGCGGGGGGDGHKYTFTSTATGWQVREDGKLIYSYTDKDTNTTYTWQATEEGWLVKDNTGKVIFTYTDKKNKDTTYSFEKKDDCGFKVTDSDGKVVFDYDNDCAGTTYTYEQTGVDFKVTDNKTGKVVFTYKGTVDTNTTYTWEDYKDGFKVTDDKGVVAYTYDPNLGKNSDGSYAIDTLLSTVFKGNTTISLGQIISFDPADLVVGETLVYDGVGTVGVITKDNGDGTYQVTTMTTSPGSRQGVRLGSVNTVADLPATCAAAEAMGWQTPQLGDFAYVTTGGAGDVISEYVITSDTDCNLTWTFSHSFNAGDYQAQSTTAMSGMILTGGAVQGTFGTPIDPSTLIRGVMRNGILLTPDAQGKVNVIVDDSHIIVNALPTTGIVDKAEYIVIDANQKVTGTWVHDATGWYQTYAAVTQVKAHQVVSALPTTAIEENVEYVVVDTNNKVTGTWVYDPAKGWLQTEVLDKPAHIVVKDLPTTDIDDEVEYVQVGDLDDPVNTFVATWVHTDNGWVKTGESVKAQKAHIAVTALPTTNINENAEYLVMTDTSDPDTLTGTWVRVNGNWVQTEKVENGYHLVTALPTTDIDDKSHYVVVGDLAQPDTTFLGEFVYDKTASKWIDLKGSTEVTYNIGRDGQELGSVYATLAGGLTPAAGQYVPFVKKSGNMEMDNDGGVKVKPGKRVEGTVVMQYTDNPAGVMADINYQVVVKETGDLIASFNPLSGTGYHGSASQTFQYTNEGDTPTTIAVKVYVATNNKHTWDTNHCTFSVHEIGRVVDPIAYMLNDGNAQEMPVGSLIQTMSNSAPKHYLICDGSEYAIGTYPELEAHFVKEFGAVDHFGGTNGKWKVPDLRGEFLRMTGANSHINQGSGAGIGEHQDGTYIAGTYSNNGSNTIYLIAGGEAWRTGRDYDNPQSEICEATVNARPAKFHMCAGRARPTNTSVNVAIKCESTPRVVVSTGTYQVSVAATQAAGTGTLSLDSTDIEGDSTMVDGDELVAPVDGLYNFGTQMLTHGSTPYYYHLTINGESISWNTGIGVSTLLRLRTGDRVKVVYDLMNAVNTGRVNMALSQVVDDKRVAEAMLKPNLWTPGIEQSFGDGVYGIRFEGKYTSSTSGVTNLDLGTTTFTPHILNFGGEYTRNNYNSFSLPIGTSLDDGQQSTVGWFKNKWVFRAYDVNSKPMAYDVWFLYTKD